MVVNSGLFFAASDKTVIDVGLPGTCTSFCWSGEGVVMKFTGPGVIYTQNRNPEDMHKLLNPYRGLDGGSGGGDGAGAALDAAGSA